MGERYTCNKDGVESTNDERITIVESGGLPIRVTTYTEPNQYRAVVSSTPYEAPSIDVAFSPAQVEYGADQLKEEISAKVTVAGGSEVIRRIVSTKLGIDVDSPNLPYDSGFIADIFPSGSLGVAESPKVDDLSVEDEVKTNLISEGLPRPRRYFYGSQDKLSIDKAAIEAASSSLYSSYPSSIQFNLGSAGGYPWIAFPASEPEIEFKGDILTITPYIITVQTINPVDSYTTDYKVYMNPSKLTGEISFDIIEK